MSQDRLRERVVRGVGWKFASQIVQQGSRIVVAVILARLLAPHDYGVAGMAIVFASLVLVFSDLALGAALVQRQELSEDDRSTVFWTGLGTGAFFTLLGLGLSWPAASFYGEPSVQPLFAVLSLTFVVTSLGTTQGALLMRELDFRKLEGRMMVGTLAGAAVGITAAVSGLGPWAIIAQQLANAFVSTALLWLVSPWRPRFVFARSSLIDLGSFSGKVFVQRLLYYLHLNADKLLIGRFVGAAALGTYTLAYNIMLVPFSRVSVPIAEVLFPAFSRMQDDKERMAVAWVRATRVVAAVSVPALVGLVAVAPDFVAVVLGPRWHGAALLIQILAWVGLLQSLQTLNGNLLQALDRTGTLLRYSVVFFAAHVAAFGLGLHWGAAGVAVAYAISTTLVEPVYTWVTARALGVSVWTLPRGLSGVVQATAVMGAAVVGTRLLLVHEGAPPSVRLVVAAVVGLLLYVPLCAWRAPEMGEEFRRLRNRGAAAA